MKKKNTKEFGLKKILNLPDIITFLNLLSGLTSIYFSIRSLFHLSSIMIIIAIIMDYLDGKTAKFLHEKTKFGKEIDSMADLISFSVAPGIFGYFYFSLTSANSLFLLIAISFSILCGLIRLARYNVTNYSKGFIGMPITMNGVIILLAYFISLESAILPYIYILSGILMISPIKIKRIL